MFSKRAVIHFFVLSYHAQISYAGGDGLSCEDHRTNCRAEHCPPREEACIREDSYLENCLGSCHTGCLNSLKGGTTNNFPNWSSGTPTHASGALSHNAASLDGAANDCFESCLMPCVDEHRSECYQNANALTGGRGRARASARNQCNRGTSAWFRTRCQTQRNDCIDQCGFDSCHEICVANARAHYSRFNLADQLCSRVWGAARDLCQVEQRNCYDGPAYDCVRDNDCYRAGDRPQMDPLTRNICIAGCETRAALNQGCASSCAHSGPNCYAECSREYLHECRHGMGCAFENEIKLLEDIDIEKKKKSCGHVSYDLDFVIGSHLFYLATQSNGSDDHKECPSFVFHINFDNGNLGQEEMLEVESPDILDIFSRKNENVISLGTHLLTDIIITHKDSALSSSGQEQKYDIFLNNCGDYIANFAKKIGYVSTPAESKTIATVLLKENPNLPNQIKKKLKELNEWLFMSVGGWSDEDFVLHLVEKKAKKTYSDN